MYEIKSKNGIKPASLVQLGFTPLQAAQLTSRKPEVSIKLYLYLIEIMYFNFFRGDVVTMECVEKIIKKDWIHPITSEKLTEKDIIPMQRVRLLLMNLLNVKMVELMCA